MARQDDDIYMKEIVKKEIVEESNKLKSPMLDFSKFNINCCYYIHGHKNAVNDIDYLSFGKYYYMASRSRDSKILIYDLRYKKIINQKKQKGSISSIKLSNYNLMRRKRMAAISSSMENIHFCDIKHKNNLKFNWKKIH
ncbi:hypothetical protein RFI_29438 [Reticulomyxa filosa]|uniref:WD repeat-containing protein n=1 Tax=Reticulomyxa filosa TaxID=46433 RepID=X6M1D8_RETFI|nr:hypothetical protein RFI_29438 [Reticulomyxa filosa]|eukprot:ETO07953.1 hypothetical protein RFI_29438 [Reticulomyxa filosa]